MKIAINFTLVLLFALQQVASAAKSDLDWNYRVRVGRVWVLQDYYFAPLLSVL